MFSQEDQSLHYLNEDAGDRLQQACLNCLLEGSGWIILMEEVQSIMTFLVGIELEEMRVAASSETLQSDDFREEVLLHVGEDFLANESDSDGLLHPGVEALVVAAHFILSMTSVDVDAEVAGDGPDPALTVPDHKYIT